MTMKAQTKFTTYQIYLPKIDYLQPAHNLLIFIGWSSNNLLRQKFPSLSEDNIPYMT